MLEIPAQKVLRVERRRLREVGFPLAGFVQAVEDAEQEGVFIREVVVNGAVGDAGFLGNLPDGGAVKALRGKDLGGGVENLLPPGCYQRFLQGIVIGTWHGFLNLRSNE